jgi:26S proteasome regulatory subunit N6
MILDKTLHGILDQGAGCLIVFDKEEGDETYGNSIEVIKKMGHVVEGLFEKCSDLS